MDIVIDPARMVTLNEVWNHGRLIMSGALRKDPRWGVDPIAVGSPRLPRRATSNGVSVAR
jgi:hypothetical protein